jgi:ATP-dependent DNA ligase
LPDLLELNGENYRARPLEKRMARLEKLLGNADGIRLNEHKAWIKTENPENPAMLRVENGNW